jgi:hypothetical protein
LISELINHDFFVQHITGIENASSMLVLKAMSLLSPVITERDPELPQKFRSYLEDNLESKLELSSEICEDLVSNLQEDVQNLFFDVLVDEEAERSLRPRRIQQLIKYWGARELTLFK